METLNKIKNLGSKANFVFRSRYARTVLPLVKPVPLGLHRPHNFMWSRVSGSLQEIIFGQLLYETSLDATNFYHRYTYRLGGLSRVTFQVGYVKKQVKCAL
jgi:hypothetical protein